MVSVIYLIRLYLICLECCSEDKVLCLIFHCRSKSIMAVSQATNLVEKIVGHGKNASVTTDVNNY